MLEWNKQLESGGGDDESECYDLPLITKYLRKWTWTSYVPLSPTYTGCCGQGRRQEVTEKPPLPENTNNCNENTTL